MPLILFAALAASLGLHGLLLWGVEFDLGGNFADEAPAPLSATLVPPPPVLAAAPAKPLAKPAALPKARPPAGRKAAPQPAEAAAPRTAPALAAQAPGEALGEAVAPAVAAPAPGPGFQGQGEFPPHGEIRFAVYRGDRDLLVGQAVHRWDISADRYRLASVTETTGLAALFKPMRIETESSGRFDRQGFHPEHYQVVKNGRVDERADFDDVAGQVRMTDRETQPLRPGSQDLLSLHYQLAYQPGLDAGAAFAVATGKRYDQFQFDALGETWLETPAGRFRTLHLQHLGRNRTEIWLALDHLLLPVQIRHTDRKGDVFRLTAVGIDPAPPPPATF